MRSRVQAARGRLQGLGHHPWPPCDGSTLQVRVKLKPQTVRVGRGLPGEQNTIPHELESGSASGRWLVCLYSTLCRPERGQEDGFWIHTQF